MSTLTLRAVKGAALNNTEIDANFTALNTDKMEKSANLSDITNAATARTNLGLGSVANTTDANKPVSTAQQAVLDLKRNTSTPIIQGDLAANVVGNGPAFYATINSQAVGAGTTAVLSCTEVSDTNSNFVANTFTATIAGWYLFSTNIQTNQPDYDAGCLISKNAVVVARDVALGLSAGEGSGSYASANWLGYLAASDYVSAGSIFTVAGYSVIGGNFSGVLVRAV